GMPRDTPYAGVAALFRSALQRGAPPRVFEDGGQRRDFVHVADVAAANLAALGWLPGQPPGTVRAFNVGSGQPHTVGELAAALAWVLGRIPPGVRPIVVDNGSTDGSAEVAARHGAVVVAETRRGFGAACHAGLLAATARYVAFCDADGSLDPAQLRLVCGPV